MISVEAVAVMVESMMQIGDTQLDKTPVGYNVVAIRKNACPRQGAYAMTIPDWSHTLARL